ncbi:MAG: carboxypeptidase regulatory-like domain-containing protein [Kofleriaceae bacterium]
MTPSAPHAPSPRRAPWLALGLCAAALALFGWRATRDAPRSPAASAPGAAAPPAGSASGRAAPPRRVALATTGGVAGVVVDERGAPVAGAWVGLGDQARTTDERGRFDIGGLARGTYALMAHGGAGAAGPLAIAVAGPRRDVVVRLHAGVALTATVVSVVDGRPVPGAHGRLELAAGAGPGGHLDATADAAGVVQFPVAALGNYQLTVAAAGFAPATRTLTWNQRAGLAWSTTVALEPGVVLSGRVVDLDGAGVAGAAVVARAPMRDQTQLTYRPRPPAVIQAPVVTDDDGRFACTVPTGQALVLVASHPRFAPGESAPLVAARAAALTITLTDGQRVVGRVVDGAGAPVADAVVADGQPGGAPAHVTRSDADGRFELTGLPLGRPRAVLFAEAPAARSRPVLVDLAALGDAPVELVVDQALTLAGTVVTAAGAPVPDAVVHVQRRPAADGKVAAVGPTTVLEAAVEAEVRADGDGRFTVDGLAAGDYQLLVRAPAAGPARASPPLMVGVVAAAGATDVVVTLPAAASVRGRVVARDGAPLDATVQLRWFGGPVAVGADGSFELAGVDPTPGRYQVEVGAAAAPPIVVEAAVAPGQVTDLGTIELTRGRTLRGRVVDQPTGGPIAGATITVDDADGARVATGRSDELGGYAVAVPAGPVVVRAAVTSVGGSRLLAVAADRDHADLALPETGRLEVAVAGDGPLMVTATRLGGADGNFRRWELERAPDTATFVAAVAPGRYVVRATRGRSPGPISDAVGPGAVVATVVGGDRVQVTASVEP